MSTYFNNNFIGDTSVAANYQYLNGTIDTQIQTLGGWFYTQSVGDCIPQSASVPPVGNYTQNFRVYYTVVSASTWFCRIGFGRTANGASHLFQIGSTSDVSGNIGGIISSGFTGSLNASLTASTCSLWIGQTGGRLNIIYGLLTSVNNFYGMAIHGCVDKTGSFRDGGIEMYLYALQLGSAQYLPISGNISPVFGVWPAAYSDSATNLIGTTTMVCFPYTWNDARTNNPTPAVFGFGQSDISLGFLTAVPIYTSSRIYLTTPARFAVNKSDTTYGAWLFE